MGDALKELQVEDIRRPEPGHTFCLLRKSRIDAVIGSLLIDELKHLSPDEMPQVLYFTRRRVQGSTTDFQMMPSASFAKTKTIGSNLDMGNISSLYMSRLMKKSAQTWITQGLAGSKIPRLASGITKELGTLIERKRRPSFTSSRSFSPCP